MCNIGEVLKAGRLARGLEIADIAKKTCISVHYLKAMEEGRFQIIPKVFDKGYLKIYAHFLHIDVNSILALYDERMKKTSASLAPKTA